jgi:putative ABC transport system ATP-binding protein
VSLTLARGRRAAGRPPRHLADLPLAERRAVVAGLGQPPFRASQLSRHFFGRYTDQTGEMTDLPLASRDPLAQALLPRLLTAERELDCDAGTTRKTLWRTFDGALVESVLMRYPDRVTMCVSSQAGCGMACPFCATGQAGLTRNLSTAEIVAQVVAGARLLAAGQVPGVSSRGGQGGASPQASTVLLRTSKLVKVYRAEGVTVEAVRGVDIELAIGEFVAIMGPSGSGKSTLLHVLGGLEPATSGEIWLRGQRVDRLSTAAWAVLRRQHIGFVFQFFNLLSNMTVADNVELPALLAGATPRQARKRREELLTELGIADKAGAAPARLSGGEQQRVALARALANEPSLLLADEPTGNLDSSNTRDVLRLLRRAHAGGQSILMVTHDARVASLADRVINLFDGMVADDAKIVPIPRTMNGVGDVLELRG